MNVRVRFCIPRGGMSSSCSASMNEWSDVTWMLVMFSFPKLKSWIVSCVSVVVKRFVSRSSGSCLRSSCSDGDMNVEFAGG